MTTAIRDSPMLLVRETDGVAIDLAPLQGLWTVDQYLKLTDHTHCLVEFSDGTLEVLPMPMQRHQMILAFLYRVFFAFLHPRGGLVLFAPLRLQVSPAVFREPDLLLLLRADDPRAQNRYWLGADLVLEVVSEDDPERDTVDKVRDYAGAGIPEYWIVNPQDETITLLSLTDNAYTPLGVFRRGDQVTSALLEGFSMSVDEAFSAS
ncbi:MAG: Uma2 family endonuclease [Roseiflexus castenholzii]|uniref:Uma2 family endonuclease n=1 Tax=Roseiflexus castenholzii TaxID=120962 RepID=UPI000CB231BE|nr:MAG: Uma2 family endonuclease [Roseiflexus castenholzii]